MIPAQSRGAAPASLRFEGTRRTNRLVDDNALGVAAIGDAAEMLVGRIKGERHVRAEILKACPALGTRAVRVDHAANRGEVAGLELGDCRADLGHAADDLMARNNRVHGGHEFAPLVTHRVKIGVADTTEQNFDLHIVFGWHRAAGLWWMPSAMSRWQRNMLLPYSLTFLSAANQFLQLFRVASALHRDLCGCGPQFAEFVGRKCDVSGCRCFLRADAAWSCPGLEQSTAFAPAARRARSEPASLSSVVRICQPDQPPPDSLFDSLR